MMTILDGFPDDVVAVTGSGHLTRQDYAGVLIPRIEAAAGRHAKLRCYFELAADFTGMDPGAMWEDLVVGVGYFARWDRVAVVTDVAWVTHAINAFRFLMPGRLRVFPVAEQAAARAWVVQP